ncbi:MAG: acetyl-CoA carboxylase carboxyl transferase subunit alpha, partial [Methylocella sp.]
ASASNLGRDSPRAEDAATNLTLTAQDLLKFGIIDGIVVEPVGGAHRDPDAAIVAAGDAVAAALEDFWEMPPTELRASRAAKFLNIGRKI